MDATISQRTGLWAVGSHREMLSTACRLRLVTIALLASSIGTACAADVIYVRSDGNDDRSGGSPLQAVATIQHALSIAADGTTVIVGAGSYSETVKLVPPNSPQGITLFADVDGELAGVAGQVHVDGIECRDMEWLQLVGVSVAGLVTVESVGQVEPRCVVDVASILQVVCWS